MAGEINVNFRPTGNPEADAQAYANANGISVDEAKSQLKSQFGDPQQPMMPQMFGTNNQVWTGGMGTPIPMVPRMEGPQPFAPVAQSPEQLSAYVSNFATVNNISEKDAARLLGLPDRDVNKPSETNSNQTETSSSTETQTKAVADYSKKEIKQIQNDYRENVKEYVKAHKKEYKAKYPDKNERMAKLYEDAEAYAENKWVEANPNSEFPKSRFKRLM